MLEPRVSEFVHESVYQSLKMSASVSSSPLSLLGVIPANFQSQMLWRLLFLVLVHCSKETGVRLGPLTLASGEGFGG